MSVLELNRPDRRNALDLAQCRAITAAATEEVEAGARVLVVTGRGSAFCSGADLGGVYGQEFLEALYGMLHGLTRLPVPVIAAVNGPAIGAGLDLACMCDMRIASEDAIFAESFVKIGIIPGDGGAWLLQRVVGLSKAAEMTFTGDPINAQEALACGLVSKVVPAASLLDEALKLAVRIAANPGHQLRMAKRLIREAQTSRLETILEMSAAFQALAHSTEEHRALIADMAARLSKSKKG